jgi:hypothetical protein
MLCSDHDIYIPKARHTPGLTVCQHGFQDYQPTDSAHDNAATDVTQNLTHLVIVPVMQTPAHHVRIRWNHAL